MKTAESAGARLEHANLTVRNTEATIRFLQTAFPEFKIRQEKREPGGPHWVHIGTDETYIAITEGITPEEPGRRIYSSVPGFNHLAYEVNDADALYERLKSAGYHNSTPPNHHPARKRVYFLDPDGNDWEFIEYLTEDRAQRHDYTIPEK